TEVVAVRRPSVCRLARALPAVCPTRFGTAIVATPVETTSVTGVFALTGDATAGVSETTTPRGRDEGFCTIVAVMCDWRRRATACCSVSPTSGGMASAFGVFGLATVV